MAQSQYAQISDLKAVGITDAAAARFGPTAMTAQLQAASSFADGYLASQFELPLVTSPQGWDMSLTLCVCNIAAYRLYKTVGFSPMAPGDDLITKSYEDAIKWLEKIAAEEIYPQFTDNSGTVQGTSEAGVYLKSDRPVGFTDRGTCNDDGQFWTPWGWGWTGG